MKNGRIPDNWQLMMLFRQLFDRESSTHTYLVADPTLKILISPIAFLTFALTDCAIRFKSAQLYDKRSLNLLIEHSLLV
ncbi:hypothetical protein NIES593_14620 [Hydrococcus rivularis NIES-593]|uniref:Uncharacterized protein n=1 Tax=Hydrococcus rivularis NIES-593 TaxID=1921803 RepID=A0A1U7HE90_9CYAN|nr:hypothetical protein [Hydrococcus rivularis]OKH21896.1 hypothetical protein NIES593_14620 [Hydrococcus rivularis NIES-593]